MITEIILSLKGGKEDLKAWMESHLYEYGEVSLEMGEADLFREFLMAQAAFMGQRI